MDRWKGTLSLAERPQLKHIASPAKSKIWGAAYLQKQSAGLFFHSPLAELFKAMQGSALHPP
ncbi:MAG: hypothetical protein IJ071_04240, partial [Ruminococcus sp.]|nr:hypothetical protein [Ruminococcus sp.]